MNVENMSSSSESNNNFKANRNRDQNEPSGTEKMTQKTGKKVESDQEHDLKELKDALEQSQQEAASLKDQFLRANAEMENMKRRFERDKQNLLQFGLENLMSDVLPVLDSMEKALLENSPSSDLPREELSVIEGMMLVKKQIFSTLEKHGLKPITALNQPFDPNLHQAIKKVDSMDVDNETVVEEFARGYTLNGRLLRASVVAVAVPCSENKNQSE